MMTDDTSRPDHHDDPDASLIADRPDDDVGSETLARYEYQVMLTALECIRQLAAGDGVDIVCEWWEDFVIAHSAVPELVSVKHLEPSQGSWSLAGLLEAGGLRHLFGRWRRAGRGVNCRLLTNGGLKSGQREAAAVLAATRGERLQETAELLAPKLDSEDVAEATAFLSCLQIEAELPKRDDLLAKLLVDVLPPLANELGWPPDEVADHFETVCAEVRRAATSDLRAEERRLGTASDTALARARAMKTITGDRLEAALSRQRGAQVTRLVRKLRAGDFGPTDIERCKRLRSDWLALEYRQRVGLGESDDPASRIRKAVQDLAVAAEQRTRTSDAPYGQAMREALVELVEASALSIGDVQLDTALLLGAAFDETDRCRIWWSSCDAVGATS